MKSNRTYFFFGVLAALALVCVVAATPTSMLNALLGGDVAGDDDLLPISDTSANETKKITMNEAKAFFLANPTFTGTVATTEEDYDATGWNGDTAPASRNNVRDKIEGLSSVYQGLDADLTSIAALTTTSFGRGLLESADAAALRTAAGLVIGTDVQAFDSDLTTWAAVTSSANGRSLVSAADYAAMRGLLDLEAGVDFNAFDADLPVQVIGFTAVDSSAVPTGKIKGFTVIPYNATITGWSIVVDAGTATVKVWKIAAGTAKPTAADSINTSGVGIASGTAVISSTLTDFTTTTVTAGDIVAYNIEAASGVKEMTFQVKLTK